MLFAPEQLQRQAPQCGTAARPEQSLYQPTERLSPIRAMTIVFARTTAGAGAGAASVLPWVAQRGRGGKVCAVYTIVTAWRNGSGSSRPALFLTSSATGRPVPRQTAA